MANELLIDVGLTETRVALVEDDRLVHLDLERPDRDSALGAVFLGRVRRIEKGLQAAYIDIGLSRDGFLGRADLLDDGDRPIEQCLHEGETILVQVIRDPVGEKGVKLTCRIALPGRFLSLTPFESSVRVTKRIAQDAERMRLAAVMQSLLALADQTPLEVAARLQRRAGERRVSQVKMAPDADRRQGERRKAMGCVVNANADGIDKGDLSADLDRLYARWIAIEERRVKAAAASAVPAELWREMGPVGRALRDHVGSRLDRIRVNAAAGFAEARAWLFEHAPDHVGRLERFGDAAGLFDLFDIEDDIARASGRRVELPSGGAIVFGQTEALTAIDVDSGRGSARGGGAFDEMALKVNLEAADEIARQLRLRGIGGIVVIDFLHMESAAFRARTVNALRQALSRDPAPTKVLGMSALGLVEMTRKRVGEPLASRLFEACSSCHGDGHLPSLPAVLAELLRRAWREAAAMPGHRLEIVCAPEVAALFEPELLARLERQIGAAVAVKSDSGRRRDAFQVGRAG